MRDTTKIISSLFSVQEFENTKVSIVSPEAHPLDGQGRFLCGNLDIRIDRDGTWYYHNTPIGRKELVQLFASVLHRDAENRYWLVTPAEKGEIIVEDAPFMAVEIYVKGQGKEQGLEFRTNIDEFVQASAAHPLRFSENVETGEPSPYILVRKNLEAKLTRSVYYQLVDLGVEERLSDNKIFGVWSNEKFFKIGRLKE